MLTLVTAFLAMGLTTQAEARHARSTVYVSGYRSCGTPIYTMRYLVGYDHCGRPIWRYRTVIRNEYNRPHDRYYGQSCRNNRGGYSRYYRDSGRRVSIYARF